MNEKFYGKPPNREVTADAEILKYKKFGDLEIVAFFAPQATEYIQNWTLLKDDPLLVSYVVYTVRSLYTFIKSML